MPPDVEFCLLGPLAVRRGGMPVPVPRGKQRAVLAALLLNAGRVVSLDELAAALWGPAPPPSAPASVRNYVKRLRHALGETGWSRISTQPHGYLIRAGPGELDISRFETLLTAAQASARNGSWETAAAQARSALRLWRGEPLADLESELLASREVPRLAELRLQALEIRLAADLCLGHAAEVIADLRRLVGDHPFREHLYALLMRALYRASRQGEALAVYRGARAVLVQELGAEPGAELRRLHEQILAGVPALAGREPALAGETGRPLFGGPGPAVPRQLPAPVAHFAGRADEMDALTGLLKRSNPEPGTLVISAIGGTAGVGKTALAVNWAHQHAGHFPAGQLYVNLRGYDPGRPVPAADALAGFLRALGVPGPDIPADLEERAARYRSLLAGRRVLVLLDNAGSVEQVRPLLPGTPACVTVVTSRDALAGLVARDGATRLDLGLLPLTDAVNLLRDLIGGRAAADPTAAADLARQCARLPLALRVAAELAVARPAVPLSGLVSELADQRRRLDLLNAGGDPRSAVRAVFSWSYRQLDTSAARLFRLIGLHPGPDLDPYAAAALTGCTVEQAARLLDVLARAYLAHHAGPGRFSLHDLLRAYAGDLAAAQDGEADGRAALSCLFDHYLHTAATAMDVLFPAERSVRPRVDPPGTPAPPLADADAARSWLDGELASLTAMAVHTAGHGWLGHTARLAAILFRYLDTSGHLPEASVVHAHALQAARRAGDRAAEGAALTYLGVAEMRQRRCEMAAGHLEQARALLREAGDRAGEARALASLGLVHVQQGRLQQADEDLGLAVSLHREIGNRAGEIYGLANLGLVNQQLGRYAGATGYLERALALCRADGNQFGEAHALTNLADVELGLGRGEQAAAHQQRALALFRQIGNLNGVGYALTGLGDADLERGRWDEAIAHHQEALVPFRETDDRSGQAQALNGLGESLLAAGRLDDARVQHTAALGLAAQIGDGYQQARAHNGLGQACHAAGDLEQAHRHWQEALALYTSLGAADADRVRAHLALVGQPG